MTNHIEGKRPILLLAKLDPEFSRFWADYVKKREEAGKDTYFDVIEEDVEVGVCPCCNKEGQIDEVYYPDDVIKAVKEANDRLDAKETRRWN